jgi:hypothetical protein
VQLLASLADALLARAEGAEVLGADRRHVLVQLKRDAARGLAADRDIKEHLRVRHFLVAAHTHCQL